MEGHKKYYSTCSPSKIFAYNCLQHDTTLVNRLSFSKSVLKVKSKLPLSICPKKCIYFFPTTSAKKATCIWFSYYHIKDFVECGSGTRVYFWNDTEQSVDVSHYQFNLQMMRTSQLIAQYNSPLQLV